MFTSVGRRRPTARSSCRPPRPAPTASGSCGRMRPWWGPATPRPTSTPSPVTLGDPGAHAVRPETAVVVFADEAESWPTGLSALCRRVGRQNVAVVVRAELPARAACLFDPGARHRSRSMFGRRESWRRSFVSEDGRKRASTPAGQTAPAHGGASSCRWTPSGAAGLERVVLDLGQDLRARGTDVTLLVLGTAVEGIQGSQRPRLVGSLRAGRQRRSGALWGGDRLAASRSGARPTSRGAAPPTAAPWAFRSCKTVHNCYTWLPQAARDAVRSAERIRPRMPACPNRRRDTRRFVSAARSARWC